MPNKPRRKNPPAKRNPPKFDVVVDVRVDTLVRKATTPREVRRAFVDAYLDFGVRGCEAADYRLSGTDQWPRFCVRRLPRGFRLVVVFPDARTVSCVLLEEHSNDSDPYVWIEEMFDLPKAMRQRDAGKPACCDDRSSPPEAHELVEALDALTRRRLIHRRTG